MMQDLSRFRMPPNFRGRSALAVQLWWLVQATLFRWSPQFAYGFRNALLRAFGAKVGHGVIVRPTVTVTYPWKVSIGDFAWVGDNAELYSLGEIDIGANAVVSQRSYLCAADHDHTQADFPIRNRKITIGAQAWLAADVFVAPGITIGEGAVIGARSSVFKDMPAGMVCFGYPCVPVKPRVMGAKGG
jgi:putative colanic acid biosynthesis acetyltransferase WcaF